MTLSEKKGCEIVVYDQISRQPLLVDVVGVENSVNAQRSLHYCKTKFQLTPEIVTVDMSPSLIETVELVLGSEVIQINDYRIMQEFNNGIYCDVLDISN